MISRTEPRFQPLQQRLIRAPSWMFTLALLAACGGTKRSSPLDSAVATENEDAAVSTSSSPDGSASNALGLAIQASKTTVCPGECVALTPRVENSEAALSYHWSQGVEGEQQTQEVCPTETTTYQLAVEEETTLAGEFVNGGRRAEDQLTVTVKDCTVVANDPVLCEFRQRYDMIQDRGPLGEGKPWAALGFGMGSHIDTDADGNLLAVGAFSGRIDLGAGELKASSPANGLVLKLDPRCKVLWSRALSAPVVSDAYLPLAMRVDAAGNTLLAGIAGPVFNLDFLTRTTLSFSTELIVQKLGPDGEELYRRRFPAGPGGYVSALDVDAEGNVYVAGLTNALSDLGTGPLGISPAAFYSYLLGLDPLGNRRSLQTRTGVSRLATGATQLFVERGGFTELDFLVTIAGGGSGSYVPLELAGLSLASQTEQWKTMREESVMAMVALSNDRLAHLTASLSGEEENGGFVSTSDARIIVNDHTGAELRTSSLYHVEQRALLDDGGVSSTPFDEAPWLTQLAAGADDSLAVAGSFSKPLDVLGRLQTPIDQESGPTSAGAPPVPVVDVLVAKLNGAGDGVWARTLSWGDHDQASGLAIAPDGSVYVAGQGNVKGGAGEYDLVIVKLRAEE